MFLWQWITLHGFELLQAIGIVGGLLFTGITIRSDDRSRRIANLLVLTKAHREIWTLLYRRPELGRVLERKPALDARPVSNEEAVFVTLVILHLASAHQAIRDGLFETGQAIRKDVRWFFLLPIPNLVWNGSKEFQDPEFVDFVEEAIR